MALEISQFFDVVFRSVLYFLLFYITYYVWNRRRLYILSWKSDGPFALPLLGSIQFLKYLGKPSGIVKLFEEIGKYKKSVRIWAGPKMYYFVQTPEDMATVLMSPKCLTKEEVHRKVFSSLVGDGLFTAPVETWRVHRKALNPMFSKKMLDGHFDTFCDQSNELIEKLSKFVGKGYFDIHVPVTDFICSLIFETTLGGSPLAKKGKSRFIYGTERIKQIAFLNMTDAVLHIEPIAKYTKIYKEQHGLIKEVTDFTIAVINEKREMMKNEENFNFEADEANDGKSLKSISVLEFLLHLTAKGEKYTDQEVVHEVITFLFGGNDTIGTTISYAVLALALHPEIQEKVYEEMCEVFGNSDRSMTVEDVAQLKYLERVVKETLRIFPVNMIHGRECVADLKLNDKITLPGGTSVALCYLNVLRDPDVWPEPLKFNPDRFLQEEISKRHPFAFVAFGGGPRNCIGYRFGIQCTKVALAHIIRKFRFKTIFKNVEDVELEVGTTTRPVKGFMVEIENRKEN